MATPFTLAWFKAAIEPHLGGFSLTYQSWGEGDFGHLDRVEFDSPRLVGCVDFWSHGWLDLLVVEPASLEERLNIFLGPDQEAEKAPAIAALLALLSSTPNPAGQAEV